MSRIRTNIITNRMANGAPTVSNGLVISGITTTSEILVGNTIKLDPVAGIVTAPAVDVDDFLDVGGNIKLGNAGVITATSFSGSGANLTSLPAAQLTGTIADARISASSVQQHATSFDDNNITNDISVLALKVSALENSAASNTNSTYVDTFQDSAGVASFTTSGRDSTGEYISSVYNVVTNISAGWCGAGGNNTATTATGASSYTGYDGVTRSAGTYGNPSGYSGSNLGHIFAATDNFEFICHLRGRNQGVGALYGNLGSTLSAVGDWKTEPPQTNVTDTFDSVTGGANYYGCYPVPDGSTYLANNPSHYSFLYRFFRENNTFKIQYIQSLSELTVDATTIATLRATTNLISGNSIPAGAHTRNEQMLLLVGEGGSMTYHRIEVANTFAESISATGSVTSVTINAASTTSKMGVVVTYIDNAGTATLNTDLKIYLSANNGSNFTQATLVAMPNFATGVKMAKANDVTISNTGTQLKWKIEFANQASGSKETRVTGISLQY